MSTLGFKFSPAYLTPESVLYVDLISFPPRRASDVCGEWTHSAHPPGQAGPASSAASCMAWFQPFFILLILLTLFPLVTCSPCACVNAQNYVWWLVWLRLCNTNHPQCPGSRRGLLDAVSAGSHGLLWHSPEWLRRTLPAGACGRHINCLLRSVSSSVNFMRCSENLMAAGY